MQAPSRCSARCFLIEKIEPAASSRLFRVEPWAAGADLTTRGQLQEALMSHWHDTMVDQAGNRWCGLRDGLDDFRSGGARNRHRGLGSRNLTASCRSAELRSRSARQIERAIAAAPACRRWRASRACGRSRGRTSPARHQTGIKNRVRMPASSGSVCSSHLTTPTGANSPIAPPVRLAMRTTSFRGFIGTIRQSVRAK